VSLREDERESGALTPLCCFKSGGSTEHAPVPFAAAGHLIASILSGPNDSWNLVPVTNEFNLGPMKTVEKAIADTLKGLHYTPAEKQAGHEVDRAELEVRVTTYFNGVNQENCVPRTVQYTLTYEESSPTGRQVAVAATTTRNLRKRTDRTVPERRTQRVVRQWTIHQNYLVAVAQPFNAPFLAFLNNLHTEMTTRNWRLENHLGYGHLKNALPKPPIPRPYAVLDYWLIAKRGAGYVDPTGAIDGPTCTANYRPSVTTDPWNRANFEGWQGQLIYAVNYARHAGYLDSDAHGRAAAPNSGVPIAEPYQRLIYGAAGNGPALDHIYPAQLGGCNAFSNCQVTSGCFNSKKGSKF
jgi:hypothetical protein